VRVVADSHALIRYLLNDPDQRLSPEATAALEAAEASDGIVMSVATMVDLYYVVHARRALSPEDLAALRSLAGDPDTALEAVPIDMDVAAAAERIPLDQLRDPYDRLILATAMALDVPLVTRDDKIRQLHLAQTIW
jgi:PIN domain nuclease of toxin-antitoxin system